GFRSLFLATRISGRQVTGAVSVIGRAVIVITRGDVVSAPDEDSVVLAIGHGDNLWVSCARAGPDPRSQSKAREHQSESHRDACPPLPASLCVFSTKDLEALPLLNCRRRRGGPSRRKRTSIFDWIGIAARRLRSGVDFHSA